MRKSSSSRANRVRTAWFPVILRVEEGVREIHVCWKYADGSVGLYSSSSKTNKSRPAWDYIKDCAFQRTANDKREEHDYFVLQNRRLEKKAFRTDELNPTLWTLNEFSSKILEMRSSGQEKLLALYISLLSKYKSPFNQKSYPDSNFWSGIPIASWWAWTPCCSRASCSS